MYDFNKVGEGIYRANDTLNSEDAKYLYDYIYQETNNDVVDMNSVPWEQGDEYNNVLYYPLVKDRKALDIMNTYKTKMSEELTKLYQEPIFPHLTTLVLWKPGQKMPRHVDDGSGSSEEYKQRLGMRKFTSICYVNDDFKGGETYIRSDGKTTPSHRDDPLYLFPNNAFTDYISKPEKGVSVIFGGGDENAHGVTELLEGTRVILSTWFTTDPMYQEPIL